MNSHLESSFMLHFANVNYPFRSNKDNELSICRGDVVIIRSTEVREWCYAETLSGDHGYIPIHYTTPVIPTEPYVPEWKTLSTGISPSPPVRIIRKDVVLRQRDSLRKSRSMHSSFRSRQVHVRLTTVVANLSALPRLRLLRRDMCRPAKVGFFCSCNRRNSVAGGSLCVVQAGSLRETRLHPSQRSGRCAEAVPCKWFLSAFQYELFGIRKLQKSTDPEAAFFAAIRKKLRISPKNMGSFIPLCRG